LAREPHQKTDWSRFKFYAPFIKSLDCSWTGTSTGLVSVKILSALVESDVEKPIFPNLCSLTWDGELQIDLYMDILFGPQLTCLTIFFPPNLTDSPTSLSQTFSRLTRSLPHLHSITICASARSWPDLTSPLSDFVCGVRNLKKVVTNIQLDHRALRHLVTSPCTHLSIANDATDILQSIIELGTTPFPEIGSLHVKSLDGTSVAGLVELLPAKKLHLLSVRHVGWGRSGLDITQLIKTISTRCSHTNPFSLFVAVARRDPDHSVDYPFSTLAPLLALRNVTQMEFFDVSFDLDDGDIENIAIAWPCLRSLYLASAPHDRRSRITLAGLVALAKHCPGLESFELAIHITVVDFSLLPREGAVTPNRTLEYIFLEHWTADLVDPAQVAKFLSRLFPSLKGVNWDDFEPDSDEPDEPDNMQQLWREVSRHLQANQAHGVGV
jgi:hypothetical protein